MNAISNEIGCPEFFFFGLFKQRNYVVINNNNIYIFLGVISFVLYRHLSWNRPQTLSDKFSNDESTGYIDDTAFRVSQIFMSYFSFLNVS